MRIIRFCVHHPVTTCMLLALFFMGGSFALVSMEVELLPNISIPTLVVRTVNPQASPEAVHKEITLPMEEAFNSLTDLVRVNATSLEGESRILLEFDWGRDVRMAEVEVREQLNRIPLPETAEKPLVWTFDPGSSPVFRFDVFGAEGTDLTPEALTTRVERWIQPRLERIPGVGEVEILGRADAEYRVLGRRADLARYNLTVPALVQALRTESQNRRGGQVTVVDGTRIGVAIRGKATSTADLEHVIVAHAGEGRVIRVRDVATVIRDTRPPERHARYDGRASVGVSIRKTSDASVVSVVESVKETLGQMHAHPEMADLDMRVSQDDSEYVLNAQDMVIQSIFQGVLLAGLLLILFLRDIRSIVIVGMATPVSIIAAFMCLHGMDLSRNVLTLGGMGLAAGMTLDSSIVLLDSIYKQLDLGKPPREAAILGASEVAGGIVSSNMTTVAVFLPILFIPGLMREIFKDLSLSIIWAILFSMVVGLLFIPMASARILRQRTGEPAPRPALLRLACAPWDRMSVIMEGVERTLEGALARVLRLLMGHQVWKRGVILLLLALSGLSLYGMPGRAFLPQGQVNELWVRFEPPVGSTLAYADTRIREVEALLREDPYAQFVESAAADVREDDARLFVRLRPARKTRLRDAQGRPMHDRRGRPLYQEERPPAWHSLAKCLQAIRDGCNTIPDLRDRTFVTIVDKLRGGTTAPVTMKIHPLRTEATEAEAARLQAIQEDIRTRFLPAVAVLPGAQYPRLKTHETPREVLVRTDPYRERLAETGLTTQVVSDTIRASIYGVQVETVQETDGDVPITVLLASATDPTLPHPAFMPEEIGMLDVRSPLGGALIPVREVAAVSRAPEAGSLVLERTNRRPTATFESHAVPHELSGETEGDLSRKIQSLFASIPGFAETYTYDLEGAAKDIEESFADAMLAFCISILLIYMILCSQFERFGDPLAIMITVPLAASGAVAMLHLAGEVTSLGALVGAVILSGVVVNNGIILVEYVNILRARGVPRSEAIISGSVRKLRSIIITSMTSILGMLPLVLGIGEGTELYRGVAAVILGGLLVSTPLTLLVLPLLYEWIDEAREMAGVVAFRVQTGLQRRRDPSSRMRKGHDPAP